MAGSEDLLMAAAAGEPGEGLTAAELIRIEALRLAVATTRATAMAVQANFFVDRAAAFERFIVDGKSGSAGAA